MTSPATSSSGGGRQLTHLLRRSAWMMCTSAMPAQTTATDMVFAEMEIVTVTLVTMVMCSVRRPLVYSTNIFMMSLTALSVVFCLIHHWCVNSTKIPLNILIAIFWWYKITFISFSTASTTVYSIIPQLTVILLFLRLSTSGTTIKLGLNCFYTIILTTATTTPTLTITTAVYTTHLLQLLSHVPLLLSLLLLLLISAISDYFIQLLPLLILPLLKTTTTNTFISNYLCFICLIRWTKI